MHFVFYREIAREHYKITKQHLAVYCDDVIKVQHLTKECLEWKQKLEENETCLIKLQINYLQKHCALLERSCDFMLDDKDRYKGDFNQLGGL